MNILGMDKLPNYKDLVELLNNKQGLNFREFNHLMYLINKIPLIIDMKKKLDLFDEDLCLTNPKFILELEEEGSYYEYVLDFEIKCERIYKREREKYERLFKFFKMRPTFWVVDDICFTKHPSGIYGYERRKRRRNGECIYPQPKGDPYPCPNISYLHNLPKEQLVYIVSEAEGKYKVAFKQQPYHLEEIRSVLNRAHNKTDGYYYGGKYYDLWR